jgi:hypothetical protein
MKVEIFRKTQPRFSLPHLKAEGTEGVKYCSIVAET